MPHSKLRIKNETRYSTRDLRRFFTAGLRALGADQSKTVKVIYGRSEAHHGVASLGTHGRLIVGTDLLGEGAFVEGNWIRMSLPKNPEQLNLRRLAQVFEHEVGHNLGLTHADMIDWWTLEPTWHEGITIAHREPRTKVAALPAPERREKRARARLAALEQQLERTERLLKKWRAKVRYYDRKKEQS